MNNTIIAAGAVVWRQEKKEVQIALVHRPRYDDWSLPKGKQDGSESLISCAYRETLEETNLKVSFGPYIGDIEYFVADGLKKVHYWSARLADDSPEFHSNEEVDLLEWHSFESAIEKVTRDSDREIIEKFVNTPFDSYPLIMLRHAKALAREEWQSEDDDRPLEQLGQQQARRMLSLYQVYGLTQIHTSDAVRCHDTVEQMAHALDIPLTITNKVSEYTWKKNKEKAIDYAKDLIKINEPIILCSHNPVLPRMMEKLTKKIDFDYPSNKLEPGEAWILHHDKKEVLQIDRLEAPVK
jgi:8-oxo-dGTP diphosphatase